MRKTILAVAALFIASSADAQTVNWVTNQSAAASVQQTDTTFIDQSAQSPRNRAVQMQQILSLLTQTGDCTGTVGASGGVLTTTCTKISGKTVNLAGNLTTVGAFALTMTLSGNTSVTVPTSGTLLTQTALNAALPTAGTNQFYIGSGSAGAATAASATTAAALLPTVTTTTAGLAPASGGGTTNFLRADLSWAAPPGTGGGSATLPTLTNHAVALGTGAASLGATSSSGAANQVLTSNGASADPTWQSPAYDLIEFFPGVQAANAIARVSFPRPFTLPAGLTGSQCFALSGATASAAIALNRVVAGSTTQVGTLTFASGGGSNSVCTMAFASAVTFNAGDQLEIRFPATPDTTLGDVNITLSGTHL